MNLGKLRNILNALFILLAVATIILFLTSRSWNMLAAYSCGAAIVVKMAESVIRLTDNRKDKE
jgi:mannose/fructose/N-acetylgalactosamine-specific phosphotransferase system component IID